MADGHPLLLDTNDRAKTHDPVFQAELVEQQRALDAQRTADAADQAADDEGEPDPIELDSEGSPRPRGKHEKAAAE